MASKNKAPPKEPPKLDGATTGRTTADTSTSTLPKGNPIMKVDFSAVASFEPRAAGEYEGTLIGHKLNAASATSGQPTVTLDWSENDSPNKHMFKTYSLQPKALWSLKRDLIRMGASVEEMNSEEADLDVIITALYGYTHTLKFGDPRPYKDKEGVDKLGDNMIEVLDPDKA